MLPFVDIHVHLLGGLDDGPRTLDDALAMAEIAVADGTGLSVALAHQGDGWPDVTPDRIRAATIEFREALAAKSIPLQVFPSAEVMIHLDIDEDFAGGRYLTVGDMGRYILIELPANVPLDPRPVVQTLLGRKLIPIIAHVERYPQLLENEDLLEELVRMGALAQVNASAITAPQSRRDEGFIRNWVRRHLVHFIASDGHSALRRPPKLRAAHETVSRWTSPGTADRLCSVHGQMVLGNLPWRPLPVQPRIQKSWFAKLFSE